MLLRTALLAVLALTLSACAQRTRPPGDAGVCYVVQPQKDGSLKYNKLVTTPDFEHCAANLEALRMKFLRMGGNQTEMVGAYQGGFIFLQHDGIFTAPSLEQHRYLALVRTGDGRLVIPGAMPRQ